MKTIKKLMMATLLSIVMLGSAMAQSTPPAGTYCLRVVVAEDNVIKMSFWGTGKVWIVKGDMDHIDIKYPNNTWTGWQTVNLPEGNDYVDIYAENLKGFQLKDNGVDYDIKRVDFSQIPTSLRTIIVHHSGYLTACQYDDMFLSLPDRTGTSVQEHFSLSANSSTVPGVLHSNTQIAADKGWNPSLGDAPWQSFTGDGSGCDIPSEENYCLKVHMYDARVINMDFKGSGKVWVVRGDESFITTENITSDFNGWANFHLPPHPSENYLKIYAENLTGIKIKDNGNHDDIIGADFSEIPDNLNDIHVYHSGYISACAYNDMFLSLPERTNGISKFYLTENTSLNNGAQHCATNIADTKGWSTYMFNTGGTPQTFTGDGTGCAPAANTPYISLNVEQGEDINISAATTTTFGIGVAYIRVLPNTYVKRYVFGSGYYDMPVKSLSNNVAIYGNIKRFRCRNNQNKVTGINFYGNHNNLTELDIHYNHISSLNVSNLSNLEVLNCAKNQLNYLNISNNSNLKKLYCYGNSFPSHEIDAIYCALPDRTNENSYGCIYPLQNANDPNYNTVMATNATNADDKDWLVNYASNNNDIPATSGDYSCNPEEYDLYVEGTQINSNNADDILAVLSDECSGTEMSYNHTTKTLTLNNVDLSYDDLYEICDITSSISGLTINVIGNNDIGTLTLNASATIQGTSTNDTIICHSDIDYGGEIMILNGSFLNIQNCSVASLYIEGDYNNYGTLNINNAYVEAYNTGNYPTTNNLQNITLTNCAITTPAGAAFSTSLHGVALNGSLVNGVIIIEPTVAVTGVSVSPASTGIVVGNTKQLTATVAPTNATNSNVTWSSSNNSIATVNTNGLVTAVAPGNATIIVTTQDGGFTATCSVTVESNTVAVTGVSVNPSNATIVEGNTQQLTATVTPANATNSNVTWSSNNNGIATVNNNGLVTAVAPGNATITVTTADGGFTATCGVTVESNTVAVTGVSVDPASTGIVVGNTKQLTATVTPANATNQNVTWSSNNNGIATVNNNGLVTALSVGNAIISVTTQDGNFTATCSVTVESNTVAVTGVSVNPGNITLDINTTGQLTATVAPANATNTNVTWSSNDNNIATVNANGLVTAVSPGNAIITVTTADGGFTATCNVTVNNTDGINTVENDDNLSLYPNPVSGLLNIESNTSIHKIEVFNALGQLVDAINTNNNTYQYNTEKLNNGYYMFKIHTDNGTTIKKVMKQ